MLSSRSRAKNDMVQAHDHRNPPALAGKLRIARPAHGGPVLEFAACELADGLGAMLRERVAIEPSDSLGGARIALTSAHVDAQAPMASLAEGYSISPDRDTVVLSGADERVVLDAVYHLMRELGAGYPLGHPAQFPRIDRAALAGLRPISVRPAFSRRCMVSDIMTWHYADPQRFAMHLAHDREFIPWMARNGINAFFYIRHAIDTRYRIEETEGLYRERGIDVEYGGHIIQQLLPRECFADHPEYFPAGAGGERMPMGNLCVSNPGALGMVRNGALDYLGRHPDSRLLHVWGADVWKGAWCACRRCREIAPQLQYMELVNAIAAVGADGHGAGHPPAVVYLAYHDTIEPAAGLRPLGNVWFEWAPRERCYSHAIDDPGCEINPRYFGSLKRYLDLFEGRGHIFEYYADAILFGGLGFAMPSVIARDLRAYHTLGIRSVSCLTFGAFSVFAYPVNLAAFARLAIDLDAEPEAMLADTAAQRHPACSSEMARAYRAVRDASALTLSYGDVMRPVMAPAVAKAKRAELREAAARLRMAIEVADGVISRGPDRLVRAERMLWSYGLETLAGIEEYLAAREDGQPRSRGQAALDSIRGALQRMREIQADIKGTWGSFDLDCHHSISMERLRQRLEVPKSR
jgi:Domain of unknown function (DUF4838)